MATIKQNPILKFLKSPFLIILAMIMGILVGIFYKNVAVFVAPAGVIYLNLLKMTVLPILITAIITSIGRLFSHEHVQSYLGRIVLISLAALFLCALLSLSISLVVKPGTGLNKEAQVTLGKTLNLADQQGEMVVVSHPGVCSFFEQLVPENIFHSMGEGASLKILFFCLIMGAATGLQQADKRKKILDLTDSLFHTFFTIISWIMYFLPIGLFSLLAGQIARTGITTIISMLKFVGVIYGVSLLLLLISACVISFSLRITPFRAVSALKECMLIAFGTQSTFASMPSAIEGLTEELGVDKKLVNLVIPLGAVLNRFSMIILYSVATVFAAQLYNIPLGSTEMLIAMLLSVLAAVAGAGMPGIVSLSMISIIFIPLGLPTAAILILLLAINPVIEPITTMSNIYANCAVTTLIVRSSQKAFGDKELLENG